MAEKAPLRVDAPPALRRRVKIKAAQLGMTMQRYVTEAVERRLAAEDAQKGGRDGCEG